MNKLRRLLAVALVTMVVLLALMVGRNVMRHAAVEESGQGMPRDLDFALETFEYTETRQGRRLWTIVADTAGFRRATEEGFLENPRFTYFGEQEPAEVVVTSRYGRFDLTNRHLELWDEVRVRDTQERTLASERMVYDDESKLLSTAEAVTITAPGLSLRGRGMRLHVESRRFWLDAEVTATIASQALKGE